jgi:hypothetical protein
LTNASNYPLGLDLGQWFSSLTGKT